MDNRVIFVRGRYFVVPQNASDEGIVSDVEFLEAFGITKDPDPTPDPEPEPDPEPTPDPEPDPNPGDSTPDPTPDPEPTPNPDPTKPDRTAQVFAQMRVQNKQYEKLLQGVASVLGVENIDNPEALLTAVQQQVVNAQAKKQGLPPELLARLNQLEEKDQLATQRELQRNAYLGFQKVKDSFKLDDAALGAFADELVREGHNPFEQPMDLHAAYISRNFNKLIQDAEARGAQKEAERAAKAGAHSTTPNNKNGQSTSSPEKITTIGELNAYFDNLGIK